MHPKRMGFDRSCLSGWHEGPRYYAPHIRVDGVPRPELAEQYGPDVYTQFLMNFMEDAGDRPFLAFYSMALCHDVTDDLAEPVPYGLKGRYDSYPEVVRAMDRQVGRLLSFLEDRGMRENTAIFFCSDNGTAGRTIVSADGGQYTREENVSVRNGALVPGEKGSLTDGGTRVPFFVSWPGAIRRGQVTDALTDLSDIFPTLVALAGETPCQEPPLDGESLLPGLLGQGEFARSWLFAEAQGRCWVRTQRWKRYADGSYYDAVLDPEEAVPLDPSNLQGEGKAAFVALGEVLDILRPPGCGIQGNPITESGRKRSRNPGHWQVPARETHRERQVRPVPVQRGPSVGFSPGRLPSAARRARVMNSYSGTQSRLA